MAKITPSDLAPAETVHYTFAGAEFDLGGSGKGSKAYETTDRALLANASSHPWLNVEFDQAEQSPPTFSGTSVRPEDDPLSATGPNAGIAFDPAEIAKVEDAKASAVSHAPAFEAGLDQTKSVSLGDVPETVAAANASDTSKDN